MKHISAFTSVLMVASISVIALLGWLVNHEALISWLPGIAKMTFNTAFCFLLIAVSCVILDRGYNRLLVIWSAMFVGLFALLSLAQDGFGIVLGIDNLLFDSTQQGLSSTYPGRMSPNTAIGFLLSATIVMMLAAWDHWQRRAALIHALLLLLTLVGLLGVGMNLLFFDVPKNYSHFASISLLTAISFLLLAYSLMCIFSVKLGERGSPIWLYSTIQLMYRLTYPQKFALISLIFLLPIAALMWHEIEEADEHVASAKLKLEGIKHIRMTNRLFEVFPEHRGMTNARYIDRTLFQDAMHKKMAQIDRLLAENARLDQLQSQVITIPHDWAEITARWESIKHDGLNRTMRWRLHTEIISMLIKHLRSIGGQTGLTRDQEPVLHNLIAIQLMIMPPLFEYIGQLRGLGVPYVAGERLSNSDIIRLGGILGRIHLQANDLEMIIQAPVEQRGMEEMRLLYQRFMEQLHAFTSMAEQQFSTNNQKIVPPEYYFDEATKTIMQGGVLNEAILKYVDQRLQQRIHQQITIQYNIKIVAMLLIIILLIVFSSFYQSVIATIQALEWSAEKMRRGEMEALTPLPARDELGSVVNAFNTVAKELMRVNARVTAVIDHAVSGIITIDRSGVINAFNPAAEAMFGYPSDEMIGTNITMLMPERFRDGHRAGLAHYDTMGHGRVVDHVIHVEGLRSSGESFPLELLITSMEHEGQRWFIGMLRDISAQQQLEAQLRHAQKMEAVGSLVGGVAHNFNNMLAGIVGKAYGAKKRAQGNAQVIKEIEAIERVAQQAGEMVKQLLLFAQKDFFRDQQEELLTSVVEAGIATVRATLPEGVTLSFIGDDPEMAVDCDASQMQQVVVNLVSNGCEAVVDAADKHIVVALQRFVPDGDFMDRHPELKRVGSYGCLSVEDHGRGMDAATMTRIFEPYYTTKDVGEGAGLGLSSTFGTVATHQGVIEVESTEGEGSLFSIYLPLIN